MTEDALSIIQKQGPISAKALADMLGVEEKAARDFIDRLRKRGEPIWHDANLGAFWWRDDMTPSGSPYSRWKRAFI